MNEQASSRSSTESDDPVVVYRTRQLHEADIVAEALKRAQIPFVRKEETLGGLSTAMPVNPPPGLLPGNFWVVAVPGRWVNRAARLVAKRPVSRELPASHRMPDAKSIFQGGTWIFVLAIILALVWTLVRMYLG